MAAVLENQPAPYRVYQHPAGESHAIFAFDETQLISGEAACKESEHLQAMSAAEEDKYPIHVMAWDFSKTEKFGWCGTIKLSAKALSGTVADLNAKKNGIPMLVNHNFDTAIGRWLNAEIKNNKLYLQGFILKGDPLGDIYANRCKKGVIDKVSIGMAIIAKKWDENDRDLMLVTEGKLDECSLTPCPLQDATKILTASAFRADTPPPESTPQPIDNGAEKLIANLNAAKAAFSGENRCPK